MYCPDCGMEIKDSNQSICEICGNEIIEKDIINGKKKFEENSDSSLKHFVKKIRKFRCC